MKRSISSFKEFIASSPVSLDRVDTAFDRIIVRNVIIGVDWQEALVKSFNKNKESAKPLEIRFEACNGEIVQAVQKVVNAAMSTRVSQPGNNPQSNEVYCFHRSIKLEIKGQVNQTHQRCPWSLALQDVHGKFIVLRLFSLGTIRLKTWETAALAPLCSYQKLSLDSISLSADELSYEGSELVIDNIRHFPDVQSLTILSLLSQSQGCLGSMMSSARRELWKNVENVLKNHDNLHEVDLGRVESSYRTETVDFFLKRNKIRRGLMGSKSIVDMIIGISAENLSQELSLSVVYFALRYDPSRWCVRYYGAGFLPELPVHSRANID